MCMQCMTADIAYKLYIIYWRHVHLMMACPSSSIVLIFHWLPSVFLHLSIIYVLCHSRTCVICILYLSLWMHRVLLWLFHARSTFHIMGWYLARNFSCHQWSQCHQWPNDELHQWRCQGNLAIDGRYLPSMAQFTIEVLMQKWANQPLFDLGWISINPNLCKRV